MQAEHCAYLRLVTFCFVLPGQDHAMLLESLLLLNTPTFFKTFLEDQALPALGAFCNNNDLSARGLQDLKDQTGSMLKLCAQYAR